MLAQKILNRLDRVRPMGEGSWTALCPAHDDHNPSLSIREVDDKVLIYCRTGCATEDVLTAVGLGWGDLFPPREVESQEVERRKLPEFRWEKFLYQLKDNLMTAMIGTAHVARGNTLTPQELEMLIQSVATLYESIETIEALNARQSRGWGYRTWRKTWK